MSEITYISSEVSVEGQLEANDSKVVVAGKFSGNVQANEVILEEGTVGVVASVQFLPPSVVYTICPEDPTATPLFASPIDTPFIIVLPTAVVVASVQVSTAAYASKSDGE